MTHEPTHGIFFFLGLLSFLAAFYFAYLNFRKTKNDAWFFSMIFTFFFSATMFSGLLWSIGYLSGEAFRIVYGMLFLLASALGFVAFYGLMKKH